MKDRFSIEFIEKITTLKNYHNIFQSKVEKKLGLRKGLISDIKHGRSTADSELLERLLAEYPEVKTRSLKTEELQNLLDTNQELKQEINQLKKLLTEKDKTILNLSETLKSISKINEKQGKIAHTI